MTTRVIHIKDKTGAPDEVYIGRPRNGQPWNWGNPFTLSSTTRAMSICRFTAWLHNSDDARAVWMREHVHELQGKTLMCFCKPHACHGDILAALADSHSRSSLDKLI